MKKDDHKPEDDEMPEEYDFSKLKIVGRGVYYDRYWRAKGGRIISPDLAEEFTDDESVNSALREYLRMKRESA